MSAGLLFFNVPELSFNIFEGCKLKSSTSLLLDNFLSLISFNVRGNKLSKPITPDEACSNGSLLLSVSCG